MPGSISQLDIVKVCCFNLAYNAISLTNFFQVWHMSQHFCKCILIVKRYVPYKLHLTYMYMTILYLKNMHESQISCFKLVIVDYLQSSIPLHKTSPSKIQNTLL